jgi:hypothetical protein
MKNVIVKFLCKGSMHTVALSLVGVLAVSTSSADASPDLTLSFSDFSGERAQAFSVAGDAVVDEGGIRLTREEQHLAGSAFHSQPTELARDRSFSAYFTYSMKRIVQPEATPADGIAFVIHNDSKNLGKTGHGMGYKEIVRSIVVELDSYHNGGDGDPDGNHVGINLNGELKSVVTAPALVNLSDGSVQHAWIEYDGSTKKIEVRVAATATRPAQATLSHTVDLASILDESASVGFTAGTGSYSEEHRIHSFHFISKYLREGIDPPCSGDGC